jgi:hypothetical protein
MGRARRFGGGFGGVFGGVFGGGIGLLVRHVCVDGSKTLKKGLDIGGVPHGGPQRAGTRGRSFALGGRRRVEGVRRSWRGSQKVVAAVPPVMAACVMARVMTEVGRGSRSISGVDPQV